MPTVYVGIGSNIDREASIRAGVEGLRQQYTNLGLSSVYESEAVGFDGDEFYNLVAAFDTEDSIATVVSLLSKIEDQNGRLRPGGRFTARTLDLDLLLYGNKIITTEKYHVPRNEIPHYAFVLWPLAELAPTLEHPEINETFSALWAKFDKRNQVLRPIRFQW